MRYYPVNLDVRNRRCLVVGGGSVGKRKAITLLNCGAVVTVVSPEFDQQLLDLVFTGSISLKKRHYQTADLNGMFLVIGATNNKKLNLQIKKDAEISGILCNIVDQPEACNFILPAIVQRGDLIIAISTSGKSPAFAKKLRKDLEKKFGREYALFLRLMGAIRTRLLGRNNNPEAYNHLFERLINSNLIELIRESKIKEINAILVEILGKGYEYETLIDIKT